MTPSHFQFRKIINNRWQKQLWDILSLFFYHCFLYYSSLILGNGIIKNNYYQKKRNRGKNEDGTFSNRTRQAEKLRYKTESEKRFRHFKSIGGCYRQIRHSSSSECNSNDNFRKNKKRIPAVQIPSIVGVRDISKNIGTCKRVLFVITFFNLRCLRTCARQSATVRECIYALHVKCSLSRVFS